MGPALAGTSGWDDNTVLLSNGSVFTWGANNLGFVNGLTNVPPDLTNAVAISSGALHFMALRADSTVEAWGDDAFDQTNVPAGLSNVIAIATGEAHSMALKADGTAAIWGSFEGAGSVFVPQGVSNITAIGAGGNHVLAICSGLTDPVFVQQPGNQAAAAGGSITFTCRAEAFSVVAYQWQFNGTNIPGATNAALTLTDVQTNSNGSYDVIISSGSNSVSSTNATFTLITPPAITSLLPNAGTSNVIPASFPLSVSAAAPLTNEYPLRYHWFHNGISIPGGPTLILNATTYTLEWQTNQEDGVYTVEVSNPAGTTSAGPVTIKYSAIPEPGTPTAWGANAHHESEYPDVQDAKGIAAGEYHSLAVRDNGTVVAWGDNTYGQTNVPSALTNVIAVAAGYEHSLALKYDGTVVAWGNTNNPADSVPTNLTGVTAIAAGWNHNIALLTNRTVVA